MSTFSRYGLIVEAVYLSELEQDDVFMFDTTDALTAAPGDLGLCVVVDVQPSANHRLEVSFTFESDTREHPEVNVRYLPASAVVAAVSLESQQL